jgi:hypothetical protein
MTLDEAIKELEADFTNQHPYTPARVSKAKQLGIEALKRIRLTRDEGHCPFMLELPGETLPGEGDEKL